MNARKFFQEYVLKLQTVYEHGEAVKIAEIAFEHVTGDSRRKMMLNPELEVQMESIAELNMFLKKLLEHYPIQYLTGNAWFYDGAFKVNQWTLIPRQETEELVERVLQYAKDDATILDVGTGSGCISVMLKKHKPNAEITAIDIRKETLEVAAENAKDHNVDIHFLQCDFLDAEQRNALPVFDIIVSNPPYIPFSEIEKMSKNVTEHEPHLALFAEDHLIFYKTLAEFGKQHLNDKMFMEIHQSYAANVLAIFEKAGYKAVLVKDLSGNDRMVEATLNH